MTTTGRKVDLDDLEAIAFPSGHEVTLVDLRAFAYARKADEAPDPRIAEHVAGCAHCERELAFLAATDPILNGEEDARAKELLALAASPERQHVAEDKARTAVGSATAGLGRVVQAAAAVFDAVAGRTTKP